VRLTHRKFLIIAVDLRRTYNYTVVGVLQIKIGHDGTLRIGNLIGFSFTGISTYRGDVIKKTLHEHLNRTRQPEM